MAKGKVEQKPRRKAWQPPVVARMVAGSAEVSAGSGSDADGRLS